MILVTGAAGKTGRAVIQALLASGVPARALVHRPEQTRIVGALGVTEVLAGDLCHADTIQTTVQGARAIYHICPNIHPDELDIGKKLITAARSAGIEHFVYHSVLHPQVEAMPHHWLKMRVEEQLFKSGLPYTILQPTAYMQNILANWGTIIENGIYSVPYSLETRLSLVDLEDVAEAAAIVLTEPGHQGAIYELVGVSAMSQTDIANTLHEQLKRPVAIKVISLEEWERNTRNSGMGEYQVTTLLKMFNYYQCYGFAGNPNVLSYLLQKQPASFTDFVKRIANEQENNVRVGKPKPLV